MLTIISTWQKKNEEESMIDVDKKLGAWGLREQRPGESKVGE